MMKSVMETAVEDGIIPTNPCKVRGGGNTKTGKRLIPQPMPSLKRTLVHCRVSTFVWLLLLLPAHFDSVKSLRYEPPMSMFILIAADL